MITHFSSGFLPSFAKAEDSLPLKEYGIGLLLTTFPDYRGTKHSNQVTLPFPYIIYRGKVLDVDDEGVKGILYKNDKFEIDLAYAGTLPVVSKNIEARKGMDDLDPTAQFGPQIKLAHFKHDNIEVETRIPMFFAFSFGTKKIAYQSWTFDPHIRLELKTKAKSFDLSWTHFLGPIYAV